MRALRALAGLATLAVALAAARPARADDEEALVRVLAEQAAVHTGPGFGFRVVYVAARGEVLPAIGRATHDHWFRVRLPDVQMLVCMKCKDEAQNVSDRQHDRNLEAQCPLEASPRGSGSYRSTAGLPSASKIALSS